MSLRNLVDNTIYPWIYRVLFLIACTKYGVWGISPFIVGIINLAIVFNAFSRSYSPTLPVRVATVYIQESFAIWIAVMVLKLLLLVC